TLNVVQGSFSLRPTPGTMAEQSVDAGDSNTFSLDVVRMSFGGPITFTATTTAQVGIDPIAGLAATGDLNKVETVKVKVNTTRPAPGAMETPAGDYAITVTASSGSITPAPVSFTLHVRINPAVRIDFSGRKKY